MKWEIVNQCPMCGGVHFQVYGQGQAPAISIPAILDGVPMAILTTYYACARCGLIFQNPRLTEESVNAMYADGTYRSFINDTQENMDKNEHARQERISEFITAGSHLDVGCSRGYLLELTRDKGCKVFGVEPNAEYVNPGIETARSIDDVRGMFDTVTCIHALEHVYDLPTMARKLIDRVKPGGRLIIEVPSDKSPGGPMRLHHPYHIQPWVMTRLFAELELSQFAQTPHSFFIFDKR